MLKIPLLNIAAYRRRYMILGLMTFVMGGAWFLLMNEYESRKIGSDYVYNSDYIVNIVTSNQLGFKEGLDLLELSEIELVCNEPYIRGYDLNHYDDYSADAMITIPFCYYETLCESLLSMADEATFIYAPVNRDTEQLYRVINRDIIFLRLSIDVSLFVCIAGCTVINILLIWERKHDIGVLRCLGMKKWEVLQTFLIENIIVNSAVLLMIFIVGTVVIFLFRPESFKALLFAPEILTERQLMSFIFNKSYLTTALILYFTSCISMIPYIFNVAIIEPFRIIKEV